MRKSFDTEFMAKVASEAIKEEKTIAALSSQYEVHRTQITKWRKRALKGMVGIFQGKEGKTGGEKEKIKDELYRQIGQLKVGLSRKARGRMAGRLRSATLHSVFLPFNLISFG